MRKVKSKVTRTAKELARQLGISLLDASEWESRYKITNQIIERLKNEGLSIAKAARLTKASKEDVTRIMRGNSEKISIDTLLEILAALGLRRKHKRQKEKVKPPIIEGVTEKQHPWRPCPLGQYWVRAHPMKGTKGRRAHCRTNPSKKDQIYADELELIAERYFYTLIGLPKADSLGYSKGNNFDHLIRGWTKYWNDVLQPKEPLDPNLVKALIATESSFHTAEQKFAGKRAGYARGLMQVTDWTVEILKDEKGELRDHLVNVTQKDMKNANLNIAAGIRWLFRKKEIASSKLKRNASWIWAVADYKSYLEQFQKNPKHEKMNEFINFYERLKKK